MQGVGAFTALVWILNDASHIFCSFTRLQKFHYSLCLLSIPLLGSLFSLSDFLITRPKLWKFHLESIFRESRVHGRLDSRCVDNYSSGHCMTTISFTEPFFFIMLFVISARLFGLIASTSCPRHLRHRPPGDLRMLIGYSGRLHCDPDTSGFRMLLAAVATLDILCGPSLLAASVMASFVWVLVLPRLSLSLCLHCISTLALVIYIRFHRPMTSSHLLLVSLSLF